MNQNVPYRDIHFPALGFEGKHVGQPVAPTYSQAPAPMGVADIGLRNVSGALAGYVLNTSSAEGTINFTDAQSVYVDGDGPDMFGVQLNSVVTNVTLFGNSTYQFWTQNFVSYTSSSGELSFGDNIWNFSDPVGNISPNVFYAHGPNGSLAAPVFYYAVGPTFTIHYPFAVSFYLNSTLLNDRPAVFFNYTLSNATMRHSGSFDYVVFNSTEGPPATPAPLALFQIDGSAYDPIGLINDIELVVVGNDNGDTTTFFQIAATLTIAYWNSTQGSYVPVPSAVNAGADTGETSNGVASFYTNPSTVGRLTLGPSFLAGLWNSTTAPGERTVVTSVTPAPALILVNSGATRHALQTQWVPSSVTGVTTFSIPNTGAYFVDLRLSEYSPMGTIVHAGGPNSTVHVAAVLASNVGLGIYTPFIAWGNAELATFALSGSGTALSPYVLYDNQRGILDPEFTQWNDFEFPVFPGLLLISTTAYVDITPPSFAVTYPPSMLPQIYAQGLPSTNNLQEEFWNVSNVALLNASQISGWLSGSLFSFYPLGDVIFWNSTGNLVAGNTFADQGMALALYGGRANTVWGNTFLTTGVAATMPANVLQNPSNQTGVWESESGDLLYNNFFSVPVPAFTPTFDPLSCQIQCEGARYSDAWNVSQESANASQTILSVPLTGSIVGTSYQGGNYWTNYGAPPNPYGVLPYNDSGWIAAGGDYVPLVPFSLFNVTFVETGLPSGANWEVSTPLATVNSTGTSFSLEGPNGTYDYQVSGPAGYQAPPAGSFTLNGASLQVNLTFAALYSLTFVETGAPAGLIWEVSLNGTGTGGIPTVAESPAPSVVQFSVPAGPYTFTVASVGFIPAPAHGTVTVSSAHPTTENVTFLLAPALTFFESGLPAGTAWSVGLSQGSTILNRSSTTSAISFSLFDVNDTANYQFVVSAAGYIADPSQGHGALPGNSSESIAFTQQNGTLSLRSVPACAKVSVGGGGWSSLCGAQNFSLAPGVYSVEAVTPGYLTYFNNVSVVAGAVTTLSIALTPMPSAAPASTAGVGSEGWLVIGILLALVVLLGVSVLLLRSRRPPPPPAAKPTMPWQEGPATEDESTAGSTPANTDVVGTRAMALGASAATSSPPAPVSAIHRSGPPPRAATSAPVTSGASSEAED